MTAAYTNLKVFRAIHGDPEQWLPGTFEDYLENCDAYRANLSEWARQFPDLLDHPSATNPDLARIRQAIGDQS